MPAGYLCALLLAHARDALCNLRFDPRSIFSRHVLAESIKAIGDLLPKARAAGEGEVMSLGARGDRTLCNAGEKGDMAIRRLAADADVFDHDSLQASVAG